MARVKMDVGDDDLGIEELLNKGVSLGVEPAMVLLMHALQDKSWGIRKDLKRAYDLAVRLADAGYHEGALELCRRYSHTRGNEDEFLELDFTAAISWCEKAVDLGDETALILLASIFF